VRLTLLAIAAFLVAGIVAGVACDGQSMPIAVGEPIQVRGGQFIAGPLPGTPPQVVPEGGASSGAAGTTGDAGAAPAGPLAVTNVGFTSQIVQPGEAGKPVSGRVSSDAVAVAFRFADMGSGYWVVPVQGSDPAYPGELTFGFSADFDANDAPGHHPIRFVALGPSGQAGSQFELELCIDPLIPDNGHTCVDPTAAPPDTVISLAWDADFDLDLHVHTPGGTDINPKIPYGITYDAGQRPPANAPHIDRDSLLRCVPDGFRREDLVFTDPPPPGDYEIYVDPFDSCGKPAVRFTVTVYRASGTCPECALKQTWSQGGELLASQATGGASPPLFVADYTF
jgi:hypothetical protein